MSAKILARVLQLLALSEEPTRANQRSVHSQQQFRLLFVFSSSSAWTFPHRLTEMEESEPAEKKPSTVPNLLDFPELTLRLLVVLRELHGKRVLYFAFKILELSELLSLCPGGALAEPAGAEQTVDEVQRAGAHVGLRAQDSVRSADAAGHGHAGRPQEGDRGRTGRPEGQQARGADQLGQPGDRRPQGRVPEIRGLYLLLIICVLHVHIPFDEHRCKFWTGTRKSPTQRKL